MRAGRTDRQRKTMNPTTESRLIAEIRTGSTTAYHAFVTGHMGLVHELHRTYRANGHAGYDDLFGDGSAALCEAAQDFVSRNLDCRFSTFAYQRIRRAMVSHKRTDALVRGTEWRARAAQKARKQEKELERALSDDRSDHVGPPTVDDVGYVFGASSAEHLLTEEACIPLEQADVRYLCQEAGQPDASLSFATLPRTARIVLYAAADRYADTNNISLTEVAKGLEITRPEVVDCLVEAWATLRDTAAA